MIRPLGLVGMMGCMLGATAACGAEVTTAVLTCGGTRVTAITHTVHDHTTAQQMWARPPGARRARPVDLRQSTFLLRRGLPGLAVVADEVGNWGCATTPRGHVLILRYDCPQLLPDDVPARFCSDAGEWYRSIAPDGALLDRGFGLGRGPGDSDPRERGLRARLGLAPDDEAGIRFRGVKWPALSASLGY